MYLSDVLVWSGLLLWAWVLAKAVPALFRAFNLFVWSHWTKQIDLRAYGNWAAITGSTDGIGKAYAKELAKRGVDIILISRNETKLQNTASEIENLYGVRTFCIKADFSDVNCYTHIEKELEDKDVGILVNNVGILQFSCKEYSEVEKSFLWNEININCGAAAQMTRIVLPKMKQKKKGLIVNMSSLASLVSFPTMSLYAPTKAFINMFSINIDAEYTPYKIKVQNLTPYFIETKLLEEGEEIIQSLKRKAQFLITDPETYARNAVYTLNTNYLTTTGFWSHSLLACIFDVFPLRMRARVGYYLIKFLFRNKTKKIITNNNIS